MSSSGAPGEMATSMLAAPASTRRQRAVDVRGLEKAFRIPSHRVETLKERATQLFARPEYRELHALRGLDFAIDQGEFFGIVGRNGSGKSTLLKLLASIYRADRGSIKIAGRVAPCIELGVGFNPELTARDNVVLNGVMMGLSPHEARSRYGEIIAFAELEEFTEMKLKNYSSGMLVRLGFSLMTHVDADVLLVDEVLAVGDASFQRKCFDAFARLHDEGRTIVLVTHDMGAVESHCDRAILLENGLIELAGEPADVARRYLEINFQERGENTGGTAAPDTSRGARLLRAALRRADGQSAGSFAQGEPFRLEIEFEARRRLERPVLGFQIVNADGLMLFAADPIMIDGRESLEPGERVTANLEVANPLAEGHYFIHCALGLEIGGDRYEPVAFRKDAADFVVYGTQRWAGVVAIGYSAEVSVAPGEEVDG